MILGVSNSIVGPVVVLLCSASLITYFGLASSAGITKLRRRIFMVLFSVMATWAVLTILTRIPITHEPVGYPLIHFIETLRLFLGGMAVGVALTMALTGQFRFLPRGPDIRPPEDETSNHAPREQNRHERSGRSEQAH